MTGSGNGVVVNLDDVVLGDAAIGLAIPVDPGTHLVKVASPGKQSWRRETIVQAGETAIVDVPALAPIAVVAGPRVRPGRRTVGWALIGTGAAAVATGVVFGIVALDKNAKSNELCTSEPCTNPAGVQASEEAMTAAWVANGSIAGGVLVAALGVYFAATSTSSTPAPRPNVAIGLGTGSLRWSF